MSRSLSHLSSIATQQTNTTGETTPILVFNPSDGTMIRLLNQIPTGEAPGIPVIMDLRNSGNAQLPTDTELIFRAERPDDDEPVTVSIKEPHIAPWNGLTTSEQRNEENIDQVKVNLKGSRVNIAQYTDLRIEINSSDTVDWNNSEFYFVREGVRELPMEG